MSNKTRVLILGGVGFIGRNLVRYLVEKDLASKIRVVDKAMPATSYLSDAEKALFGNSIVEYKQGNLCNTGSIEKCFDDGANQFNIVINLAAETKLSQSDAVYEEKILNCSVKCATEAAKRKVEKYIEVSDSHVYEHSDKNSKEDGKVKPWTAAAKYKLMAEEQIAKIPNLNYIIVRLANVYGPGDFSSLTPRIICGAVYKFKDEKMEFLWDKDLKMHSVHVRDAVRAIWHAAVNGKVKEVYNVVDHANTTQGSINKLLEAIFGIKTGYVSTLTSQAAKLAIDIATEAVNDKHLEPWAELCKQHGIASTPLTPYLDADLLKNNDLAVDGAKLESIGFVYDCPDMTPQLVKEQIDHFTAMKLFPKIV